MHPLQDSLDRRLSCSACGVVYSVLEAAAAIIGTSTEDTVVLSKVDSEPSGWFFNNSLGRLRMGRPLPRKAKDIKDCMTAKKKVCWACIRAVIRPDFFLGCKRKMAVAASEDFAST